MKSKAGFAAAVLGLAMASGAFAQSASVTITGPVVRYTPGQTIVIRGDGDREMSYVLRDVVVPSDVAVGKTVTLYTEPGSGKEVRVSKVTLADGSTETTTTTTTNDNGKYITINGVVTTYESGKSVTIKKADGSVATYTIAPASMVPEDLVTGKKVTVKTTTVTSGSPTVEKITYTTTTKTTTIKK